MPWLCWKFSYLTASVGWTRGSNFMGVARYLGSKKLEDLYRPLIGTQMSRMVGYLVCRRNQQRRSPLPLIRYPLPRFPFDGFVQFPFLTLYSPLATMNITSQYPLLSKLSHSHFIPSSKPHQITSAPHGCAQNVTQNPL